MQQAVVNPLGSQPTIGQPNVSVSPSAPSAPLPTIEPPIQPQTAAATTSEKPISPDIINLANNPDLSIQTIAHEASRIHQKEEEGLPDDEVVISLR
jgi:hypothetical protein